MAFFINVVLTSNKGNMIGNPKMASSVKLFPAFDAMVDNKLNTKAIPVLPNNTLVKKSRLSSMLIENKTL